MKYRGIFEYEYPTEHKPPVSIDVHLHGDCVKGKIIEWEYRPLEQEPTTKNGISNRTSIYKAKESKEIQEDLNKLSEINEPTTKNDLAQERYQDLIEYFGGENIITDIVLNDKNMFKAWLDRVRWYIKRANELARELEQLKSTTKNDLGVDAVSRQAVLDLIADYDLSMEQVVKGIHALPTVTPQEPKWIPISEKLPNKNQWVLVTTEDCQKIAEVMCYQGIRIGRHDIGNGWEEYEYPSWTSGHGDIQGRHPKAWMPLPKPYSEVEE